MKRILLLTLLVALSGAALMAQAIHFGESPGNPMARTEIDLRLWPFVHGVASGDPMPDRVIIWTRITPGGTAGPITVDWKMATDTGLTNVVRQGNFSTDADRDWTIKIDVDSLAPDTWYYYRFWSPDGRKSLTGRTHTAPVGAVDSLRFGIVSCSDYVDGFFHGYKLLTQRNDIDAIIHLGDYIYENGQEGNIGRPHDPPDRITELEDYRQRYSQYRLDEDLRCLHQMYPFINVWDDHEMANNAWMGGAEAHDVPADGVWEIRKRMAARAYAEWIPIRLPDPQDTLKIYRTSRWGDLADFIMLDTRVIGRDSQAGGNAIDDPGRFLLGPQQLSWASNEMQSSIAQWKIIGQQVMMAPLEFPFFGPFTTDAWDGYRAERQRFYDTVLTKNIENVVVLTGDIHSAWANNLRSGNDKVGVEFICTSITTLNSPFPVSTSTIQSANPHVEYVNVDDHGYYILDINRSRAQADFHFVGDITDPNDSSQTSGPYWYTLDSARTLQSTSIPSQPRAALNVLQPSKAAPNPVGVSDPGIVPQAVLIGTYPNPFWENFVVKLYLQNAETVHGALYDEQGRKVRDIAPGKLEAGLNYIYVPGKELATGLYLMKLEAGGTEFVRRMLRF